VRLLYRSQRVAVRVGLLTLLPLASVGAVAAVFSVRAAGASVTFDVLIGVRSAFEERAGAGGVVLAVVGYLFLPTLTSVLIAAIWDRVFGRGANRRAPHDGQRSP
jgi:hypothetical protein